MPEWTIRPLEPLPDDRDSSEWADHHPKRDGAAAYWTTRRDLRVELPGVRLRTFHCPRWSTCAGDDIDPPCILVSAGYPFEPSGPTFDDPRAVAAALVHDVICTPVVITRHGSTLRTFPVASYLERHALYRRILRAQGASLFRAWYSWAGLIAANWAVMLWME